MKGKFFLDTNILVYSFDPAEPEKREKSRSLIAEAVNTASGIVSYQVIQEFMNVSLQKFKIPFTPDDCFMYVSMFLYPLCEIFPSLELYREAVSVKSGHGFSFYDSLIISSALLADCRTLYSEDLSHGQTIRNLKIVDPFKMR